MAAAANNPELRQLRIKTGVATRLSKEVTFHRRDKRKHEEKLLRQREAKEEEVYLRKTQEFVDESEAVLTDTRGRLVKAVGDLEEHMDYCDDETRASEDFAAAEAALARAQLVVEGREDEADAEAARKAAEGLYKVAVFGSSRCTEGDELYAMAAELGGALAAGGFHTISGGYMGTMEALSKAARAVDGAVVEGVVSHATFPHRGAQGNGHLTVVSDVATLQDRIAAFAHKAQAFVVLPGNCGTLAEFTLVWNVAVVGALSGKPSAPILAFRQPWKAAVRALQPILGIAEDDIAKITFVDTPAEAVAALGAARAAWDESRC